jgi:thiamine biosynthesis lipoprotein
MKLPVTVSPARRELDRRTFLALGGGALAVWAVPSWLRPRERLVRLSVPVMGTVADFAVPAREERMARQALSAAAAELRRVESLMTRFAATSDVGRYNGAAEGTSVSVSPETAEVVRAALEWARWSDGAFDPTLAQLSVLWDPATVHAPPDARLIQSAASGAWRAMELPGPGEGPRLRRVPGTALDLGGIAKGYGVDRAATVLREHGVFRGLVNVGGDLMALGDGPGGRPWRIGVRDPARPDELISTLEVVDQAVATSGDYLRYFEYGGRRYHHILDGTTRAPSRSGIRSVTVTASEVAAADAAATMAFTTGPEVASGLLERREGALRIAHSI